MPQKPIFLGGKFSIGKIVFWLKFFWVALFTKVICTFLKSVWKHGFFDTPFDLFKEKKFSSLRRDNAPFCWELKRSKMEETAQYFEKRFFINISQIFIALYATHRNNEILSKSLVSTLHPAKLCFCHWIWLLPPPPPPPAG